MKIHIFKPTDSGQIEYTSHEVESCPSLEALQEYVGGYIERCEVLFNGQECDMIVNEEGLLLNLPYNPDATNLRVNWLNLNGFSPDAWIVGTAVVFEGFGLD